MKQTLPRKRLGTFALLFAGLTLITGVSIGFATTAGKHLTDPWAGFTDSQKQAQVDAAHAANVKYLQDFESRHGDPRSLPIIKVSTYAPPASSMGVAAAQSVLIVHARVTDVHFLADPGGGMPQTNATISPIEIGKGSASASLVVVQSGGPVAQANGGALVELEDEDLMLPGDEVLLLLRPTASGTAYTPVYGPGVQMIVNGKMSGHAAVLYGVDGTDFVTVWGSVVDPNVAKTAFPLRSSE